jgi:hypothetical protein
MMPDENGRLTDEEVGHAGKQIDDMIQNTFATLGAGKCMFCDCQQFGNSMCLNSGLDCDCGHSFDSHLSS